MRIVDVRERTIPLSRYSDPRVPSGGLTTSLVAVVTDVYRNDSPIVGYGYASVGRFGQAGLIRERFAPRLIGAPVDAISAKDKDNLDPFQAWAVMMSGEKPGGHGERCVAVGAIDMAVWDAASKIADMPLRDFLAARLGRVTTPGPVPVYASGGYPYPDDDLRRLRNEIGHFVDLGFTHAKIKIGSLSLHEDLQRIETAASKLGGYNNLAVDAMNVYDKTVAQEVAAALQGFELRWFEDICDPHDFDTLARVGRQYAPPIAVGEAIFSEAEAALLDAHCGLRRDRDILVFDPVHSYGLTGFLRIVNRLETAGWSRHSFWPHGGNLFGLQLVAALGLGGAEVTPSAFHPFAGLPAVLPTASGLAALPDAPGIGFELDDEVWSAFQKLH